jgi:hypothetical protein
MPIQVTFDDRLVPLSTILEGCLDSGGHFGGAYDRDLLSMLDDVWNNIYGVFGGLQGPCAMIRQDMTSEILPA